jgi:hypothetical protein
MNLYFAQKLIYASDVCDTVSQPPRLSGTRQGGARVPKVLYMNNVILRGHCERSEAISSFKSCHSASSQEIAEPVPSVARNLLVVILADALPL